METGSQGRKAPYYAVIFYSKRTDGDNGYGSMADRMEELARLSQVESMKVTNDEAHPGHVRVEMMLLTFCRPQ